MTSVEDESESKAQNRVIVNSPPSPSEDDDENLRYVRALPARLSAKIVVVGLLFYWVKRCCIGCIDLLRGQQQQAPNPEIRRWING